MTNRFAGKVALVTGAGSGIGRACAQKFAQEGANVIIADIVEEGGKETERLIREVGGEATFVKTNVAQASEVEALVLAAIEVYGRIDYAFNNAGVGMLHTPLVDVSEAEFDRIISINLKGVWLCMKYEIAQMVKQGGGVIVNTASGAGLVGVPNISAYVASKHGIVGITKTAAIEYADVGIRVNAVCPGVIDTPLLKRTGNVADDTKYVSGQVIKRLGKPEEIASAVAWLCSDEAAFVTGVAMPVDGGYTAH